MPFLTNVISSEGPIPPALAKIRAKHGYTASRKPEQQQTNVPRTYTSQDLQDILQQSGAAGEDSVFTETAVSQMRMPDVDDYINK